MINSTSALVSPQMYKILCTQYKRAYKTANSVLKVITVISMEQKFRENGMDNNVDIIKIFKKFHEKY